MHGRYFKSRTWEYQKHFCQNGYPESFLRKQMNKEFVREVTTTTEKKPLYLRLRFKGDVSSEVVTSKLKKIVQRIFPAADLKFMFNTRPILMQQAKDKLPSSTTLCVFISSTAHVESVISVVQLDVCLNVVKNIYPAGWGREY